MSCTRQRWRIKRGFWAPTTATPAQRSNLAASLHGLGEYEQAVELHRQTLEDRTRILGPQHPDTLRSRSDLELTFAASRAGRRRRVR
ncbi:tetratricopeptide repeat protein [Streptomyces sp. T1317-0309]|nr:tetratricopeptide repeat protein [Streptomyces sp. T1317-0309]